jgi:hypothetical protein
MSFFVFSINLPPALLPLPALTLLTCQTMRRNQEKVVLLYYLPWSRLKRGEGTQFPNYFFQPTFNGMNDI